jgi:hypothetical protein
MTAPNQAGGLWSTTKMPTSAVGGIMGKPS